MFVGKLDTLDADLNEFASGRGKSQFMNANFLFDSVAALRLPYSTLGVGVLWLPRANVSIKASLINTTDSSTTTGFDDFGDGASASAEAGVQYRLAERPGGMNLGGLYSFDQDFAKVGGLLIFRPGQGVVVPNEHDTWAIYCGPVPSAPLNRLAMLTDYVAADERIVACRNQDVAYGGGSIGLEVSPVVIQVPDFGNRFWVYQAVDTRTDGFAKLGKMYGTTPGFYLLVGPSWQGEVPKGISQVFRASTNTGFVAPRIFMDDTPEDRRAIQPVLRQIMMYPLSEYDGTMKNIEWSTLPRLPNEATGDAEVKWVKPETFFDELPAILDDAPPLPGEEARYAQMRAVLQAAKGDPELKDAMVKAAAEADAQLVTPLFQFRNYGQRLPHR